MAAMDSSEMCRINLFINTTLFTNCEIKNQNSTKIKNSSESNSGTNRVKKPFKKKPNPLGFLNKQEKIGKIIQKLSNSKP